MSCGKTDVAVGFMPPWNNKWIFLFFYPQNLSFCLCITLRSTLTQDFMEVAIDQWDKLMLYTDSEKKMC